MAMRTRSAYLLLVVVLLGSSILESRDLAEAIPYLILDFDYVQNFENLIGKTNFVAEQFSSHAIESLDVNNTTYFAFYVILSAFVFIKIENQKIKFYNIRRMVSFIFIIILVSSAIVAPFSYSVSYWNDVLAQEDISGDKQIDMLQSVENVTSIKQSINITQQIRNNQTAVFDENLILFDNSTVLPYYNEIKTLENNLTTTLIEILNLTENITTKGIEQNYSETNQTITLRESLNFTENLTTRGIKENYSQTFLEELSIIDNVSILIDSRFTNKTILPNATESWQFENSTENIELIGDAEIDYIEGINGNSLVLDGDNDFAQTNSTYQKKIKEMSLSVWIKPNYTKGSPEFTIVSKEKSFVLSVNNLIEPRHIAKFSIYDGKSWYTVTGSAPINNWSHIAATFDRGNISLYVNGTLDGILDTGPPKVASSSSDVIIGASMMLNSDSNAFNMFSGMIDGLQLFDSMLEPEEVMQLYMDTIPIKTPKLEPEAIDTSKPSLRFSILNSTDVDLPVSIPAEDLNNSLNQLTVSTWINPNYTGGSAEFTVIGKDNSFVLALNKLQTPQRVAKFSVYDGGTWYTVTGSTPINNLSHVAVTINGENILLYVNGTLDGRRYAAPTVAGSAADIMIGAYERNLRGQSKISNFFSGAIQEAEVYKYAMTDSEILDNYHHNQTLEISSNNLEKNKPLKFSREEYDAKFKGFSPKISRDVLSIMVDTNPQLAANELGINYVDDHVVLYIELDSIDSISSLPNNIAITGIDSKTVVASLSLEDIVMLSNLPSVIGISMPVNAIENSHAVSEGVDFSKANVVHDSGIDGSGVTLAVIDSSFFTNDPEIQSNIISATLFDSGLQCGGSMSCGDAPGNSHGTAVAEIVVDMAPGVNLRVYTIRNSVDFNNAVQDAINKNVDIISTSLGFHGLGGDGVTGFYRDGTSTVAKKINEAWSNGILVTISAANSGNAHWMGNYVISPVNPAAIGLAGYANVMNFQPGQVGNQRACLPITYGSLKIYASWNEWVSTDQDYDLFLYSSDMSTILAASQDIQNGAQFPLEIMTPLVAANNYCIVLASWSSTENHFFHIDVNHNTSTIDPSVRVKEGSIVTPADASGALSVGAIYYLTDTLESFSSRGPTDDARLKPEICGPDGVFTHQYDPSKFFGTSASAPHVAGAAALFLDMDPSLTNVQLRNELINNARFNPAYSVDNLCGGTSGALLLPVVFLSAEDSASVKDSISAMVIPAILPTTKDSASVQDSISAVVMSTILPTTKDSASVQDSISAVVMSTILPTTKDSASVEDSISAAVMSTILPATEDSTSVEDSISTSISSQPPPSTPTLPDEVTFTINTGHHRTGGGPSVTSFGIPSSPKSGSGNSEPKPEIIVDETTNYNPPPVIEEKYEKTEPQPTTGPIPVTKSDDVNKEEEITSSNMTDFIQQIKNIQLIMMVSAISLVIAVFLVRARGILFG